MKITQRSSQLENSNNLVITSNLKTAFDSRWSEIKIVGKNIQGRSNHAAVFFDHVMYVHGGYDPEQGILSDFYSIDLSEENSEFCWERLPNEIQGHPIKLKSHSGIIHKTLIILFGGQISTTENSNCLYLYDIVNKKWKKMEQKQTGVQIPKVDSHCACVIENRMYVYGGYIADQARFMRDVYCLDLDTFEWRRVYESVAGALEPQPRSCAAMVAYKDLLWIFGGSNGSKTLNDFWKFDVKLGQWQKIQCNPTPEARRGHSMVGYKDYIFMFGGIQDVTREKNDIYIYEFDKNSWNKIHTYTNSIYECSPTLKKSRKQESNKSIENFSIHRLSPLKSSYSGEDLMKKIMMENRQKKFLEKKRQLMKQFSENHDEHAQTRRVSPTTQSMMKSLQSIGDQQDNRNGYRKEIVYDETRRFIIGKKPCARDGQTVALCGHKMYIFGGDRHLMCFNDLYYFDLEKGVKSLELYRTT